MCFENNKTGQREGLSTELAFELRSRNKREAVMEGSFLSEVVHAERLVWPEAGMSCLSSETERSCISGWRTSKAERFRVPSLSDSSVLSRVGDLHNSRGRCPNFQPACNQHLP